MGGSWVLFFISDNQEIQHGSPGVLGLIFYNGQPRIRESRWTGFNIWESRHGSLCVLGLFFITDNHEEFQHDESLAHNFSKTIHFVFTIIFQTLSLSILIT